MKKFLLFLLLMGTMTTYVHAQKDSLSTLSLSVGQDSFFGFYMSSNGAYAYSDRTSLTFYANYWANPAFGNSVTGTDFWTEVGMGLNFNRMQGKLNINPSLGITYGKVLSGGEKGVLGDGIVPSIFVSFNDSKFDVTAGVFWFKALKKEGAITVDYTWSWFSPGYKLNQQITAGLHYEEFSLSRISEGQAKNLYTWIGPSLQYNFSNGAYLKVTAGYDIPSDNYIRIFTFIPLTN